MGSLKIKDGYIPHNTARLYSYVKMVKKYYTAILSSSSYSFPKIWFSIIKMCNKVCNSGDSHYPHSPELLRHLLAGNAFVIWITKTELKSSEVSGLA
jgi:hypothetical protein